MPLPYLLNRVLTIARFTDYLKRKRIALLVLIVTGVVFVTTSQAADLIAHEAKYQLIPIKQHRAGEGEMITRRIQGCPGWQETSYLQFPFDDQTISAVSTISEWGDGQSRVMRFETTREINFQIIHHIAGFANVSA
ncbi:MAG: hypothetical protein AAF352_09425, partial [Pseudomonadota bacterium]